MARRAPVPLRVGEPHVWLIDLRAAVRSAACLTDDEQERAARFATDELRERWVVSRVATRDILARYVDEDPRALTFGATRLGKPFLRGSDGACPLAFSVSHSEHRALLAVDRTDPVGVDVERIQSDSDIDALVARFFSEDERAGIKSLTARARIEAFFRCWTRKEAVLKAHGTGLVTPLAGVSVDWNETPRPSVRAVPADFAPARQWSLVDIDAGPAFAASLAAPHPIDAVRTLSWEEPA